MQYTFLKCSTRTQITCQSSQWHRKCIFMPLNRIVWTKVVIQGKLFQRCTYFLYCSVLSLGGNIYTRRMSKPDMGSIFHMRNQWNILVIGNYYVNYHNYQNVMLLTSSETGRTLMHQFLFTKFAQRELVSMWTQSIRNCNQLSLHHNLDMDPCWKVTVSDSPIVK